MNTTHSQRPWFRRLNVLAGVVGLFAVLGILLAAPGYRFGLIVLGTAFELTKASAIVAMVAVGVGLIAVVTGRVGQPKAWGKASIAGLLAGILIVVPLMQSYKKAKSVPAIHDITTDRQNPPQFVDVVALRANAKNPPEYAGAEIGDQQAKAYPDIETLSFSKSPAEVLAAAEKAALAAGWEVVASVATEGRLEAVATTFWYGYKDDIVVRIQAAPAGSIMDVRSKSRVGRSDLGTNAARIRAFTEAVKANL